MATVNGTETGTKQEVLVDIQALKAVKESHEQDVRRLVDQKNRLTDRIDVANQDLRQIQQRILSEKDAWEQKKARDYTSWDGQLKIKEANLSALESQLNSREFSISNLEQLKADTERKEFSLNAKSLEVERLRIVLAEQKMNSDSLLARIESDRQGILQDQRDVQKMKDSQGVENSRLEERRAVMEKKEADINFREQTVADAAKGLTPKIKDLEEREEKLSEATALLEAEKESVKQGELACEEHEKRLEARHKTQEELQAKLHAEETKYRKKGLDLVTWEQALTAKEEEYKKKLSEVNKKLKETVG